MKTNLQKMRKRAGYKSAKAFADAMGISKDTYTGYEQGRISFTVEKACEFADALGCSLDELAGRSWNDPKEKERPDPGDLITAMDGIARYLHDSGYENLGDVQYVDEDGTTDEDADALSDVYGDGSGRSMVDVVDEISSGESRMVRHEDC